MSYYRECPNCHAHLDPGEKCDCEKSATPANQRKQRLAKNAQAKEAKGKCKSDTTLPAAKA